MSRTFRKGKPYSTKCIRDGKQTHRCRCIVCYGHKQVQRANADRNDQFRETGLRVSTRDFRHIEDNPFPR